MSEVINKHSRMPRKYSRRTLRRREELAKAGQGNLDGVDALGLIARYQAGERIMEIAKEYGVSRIAMYAHLLRYAPDEWIAAQKAKAFAMKEDGEVGLDESRDALDVAIAREKLRAGQWDLERVMRKEYGRDEANININVVTDLGDRLRRSRERVSNCQVIEHVISTPPSIDGRAGAMIELQPADSAQSQAAQTERETA